LQKKVYRTSRNNSLVVWSQVARGKRLAAGT
jgi:hypothetical protein